MTISVVFFLAVLALVVGLVLLLPVSYITPRFITLVSMTLLVYVTLFTYVMAPSNYGLDTDTSTPAASKTDDSVDADKVLADYTTQIEEVAKQDVIEAPTVDAFSVDKVGVWTVESGASLMCTAPKFPEGTLVCTEAMLEFNSSH